jgi:hypothetical protein
MLFYIGGQKIEVDRHVPVPVCAHDAQCSAGRQSVRPPKTAKSKSYWRLVMENAGPHLGARLEV